MRREEGEFDSNEEDTEFDNNLLQNITEKWDEAFTSHDDQLSKNWKKTEVEKSNVEDARKQAMKTFTEPRKRNRKNGISRSERKYDSAAMVYLKIRAKEDSYFKQQELELRKQELILQQEREGK